MLSGASAKRIESCANVQGLWNWHNAFVGADPRVRPLVCVVAFAWAGAGACPYDRWDGYSVLSDGAKFNTLRHESRGETI